MKHVTDEDYRASINAVINNSVREPATKRGGKRKGAGRPVGTTRGPSTPATIKRAARKGTARGRVPQIADGLSADDVDAKAAELASELGRSVWCYGSDNEGAGWCVSPAVTEPRPCPWCAQTPYGSSSYADNRCAVVVCVSIGCPLNGRTISGASPEAAIQRWNNRAGSLSSMPVGTEIELRETTTCRAVTATLCEAGYLHDNEHMLTCLPVSTQVKLGLLGLLYVEAEQFKWLPRRKALACGCVIPYRPAFGGIAGDQQLRCDQHQGAWALRFLASIGYILWDEQERARLAT